MGAPATVPASHVGGNGQGKPSVGAEPMGDPLLPQTGNGGYHLAHYRIYLDYAPADNSFNAAETTIRATADRKLKRFTLDFQDLDVESVEVDGRPAGFEQGDATP